MYLYYKIDLKIIRCKIYDVKWILLIFTFLYFISGWCLINKNSSSYKKNYLK